MCHPSISCTHPSRAHTFCNSILLRCISTGRPACNAIRGKENRELIAEELYSSVSTQDFEVVVSPDLSWRDERFKVLETITFLRDWIDSCPHRSTISEVDEVSCSFFWLNILWDANIAVYSTKNITVWTQFQLGDVWSSHSTHCTWGAGLLKSGMRDMKPRFCILTTPTFDAILKDVAKSLTPLV